MGWYLIFECGKPMRYAGDKVASNVSTVAEWVLKSRKFRPNRHYLIIRVARTKTISKRVRMPKLRRRKR